MTDEEVIHWALEAIKVHNDFYETADVIDVLSVNDIAFSPADVKAIHLKMYAAKIRVTWDD